MTNASSTNAAPTGQRTVLIAIFAVALALHFYLATRNWHAGQLTGHEFRQTQTALSSLFIQREHNYSLAYPTPVLGKPWSLPMEFPLYQWSVVALSNLTHWPLAESGRAVTLVCFYLTLPALYLLLGQLGLPPLRRLPGLALALTCPLYIFYTRAFLIEAMALMFSVWFLVAFVQTMRTRRVPWLAATVLCGTAAGLVKVTTFLGWMLPAAGYGLYAVWRDWPRAGRDWRPLGRTLAWGAACAALPCAASVWWVDFADRVKAANISSTFLTSGELRPINFGAWPQRFSGETWAFFLKNWQTAVMPLGLMAGFLLLALLWWRRTWLALAAASVFLIPQLVFPILFSWHDYYFYAIALLWLVAAALVLDAINPRLPRGWLAAPLLLLVLGLQLDAYRRSYYHEQIRPGNGGSHLTDALRDLLPKESVIIVAGDDWSSVIPYYAQRRALMLRRFHEEDWPYVERAFAALADEDVSALILIGDQRQNRPLVEQAARVCSIDPNLCFAHQNAEVYISSHHRPGIVRRLSDVNNYGELVLAPQPAAVPPRLVSAPSGQPKPVPPGLGTAIFKNVTPKPTHYDFAMGLDLSTLDGMEVIGAHPDATLWLTPPAGAREILWEFAINRAAYEKDGDRTDGVDFIIREKRSDDTEREIYRRTLDPAANPADRGLQTVRLDYTPAPGAQLLFMTRPHDTYSYDWAFWRKILIR